MSLADLHQKQINDFNERRKQLSSLEEIHDIENNELDYYYKAYDILFEYYEENKEAININDTGSDEDQQQNEDQQDICSKKLKEISQRSKTKAKTKS